MDYTEIIEREALKYSEEKWKHPSSNLSRAHCSLDFEAGIKSNISKQIAEIEKLEFADKFVKDILKEFHMQKMKLFEKGFDYKSIDEIVVSHLKETTHLRDKLINELKLK